MLVNVGIIHPLHHGHMDAQGALRSVSLYETSVIIFSV